MKTFSSIFNATQENLKAEKAPLIRKKNERAVDAAIDSAIEQKIDAEEELSASLEVVREGKVINVNKVLELRQKIDDCDKTIEALKEFKTEFFAEEK